MIGLKLILNILFLLLNQLNFDRLLAKMWDEMGLVRVYTKPQGQQPDFADPVVLSAVSKKIKNKTIKKGFLFFYVY